jgi:hypothetical protein
MISSMDIRPWTPLILASLNIGTIYNFRSSMNYFIILTLVSFSAITALVLTITINLVHRFSISHQALAEPISPRQQQVQGEDKVVPSNTYCGNIEDISLSTSVKEEESGNIGDNEDLASSTNFEDGEQPCG